MSDRWSEGIRAGSTDVSIPVLLRDVDDNLEVTGKVFGDVTASYWRQGGVRTAISAITLAAVDSAHADGGFKEVDATNQAGLYRFDLPDAVVASGADWVVVTIKVSGCFVFHERFPLTSGAFKYQMTEDYAADGVAPTPEQALFSLLQNIREFAISGTTLRVKKLDKSTTAETYTLNDAVNPSSRTRAS